MERLYGWFDLHFYGPGGYVGTFGNNHVEPGQDRPNGVVSQEFGIRIAGDGPIPLGDFNDQWRGPQAPDSLQPSTLRIIVHRENPDAFELFWTNPDRTQVIFYGVGNLTDSNRLIGWYREALPVDQLPR